MAKKRNLNGLPNTLEQRYFSTLFSWGRGYMEDWIWHGANEKNISDVEIDIINLKVKPKALEIEPIIGMLPKLHETINLTLEKNNFPLDFIQSAKFEIYISKKFKPLRLFTCRCIIIDKEGKEYLGKTYTEQANNPSFKAFPLSFAARLLKMIRNL